MKKSAAFLLCLSIIFASLCVFAFAGEKKFFDDYFPDGKIEKPDTAFVTVDNKIGASTVIDINFPISQQIYKFGQAYEKVGYSEFCKNYGLSDSSVIFFAQVDYSVNSKEDWQYTQKWDKITSYGSAYIGYSNKIETQRVIEIHDRNSDFYRTLHDITVTGTNDNGKEFAYLDLENNTIYFRYRFCVSYTIDGEAQERCIFSDWSEPFSHTAENGNNKLINAPESLPAPTVSELRVDTDGGESAVKFTLEFPQSFYEAELYFEECGGSSGELQAQIKVKNGEWTDLVIPDAEWKTGGVRTALFPDDFKLDELGGDFSLRVRLNGGSPIENSPWSNIASLSDEADDDTKTDNATDAAKVDAHTDIKDSEIECSLCGFCPIQPLGICLFIWLVAIIAVTVLIVIAVKLSKKKEKKK